METKRNERKWTGKERKMEIEITWMNRFCLLFFCAANGKTGSGKLILVSLEVSFHVFRSFRRRLLLFQGIFCSSFVVAFAIFSIIWKLFSIWMRDKEIERKKTNEHFHLLTTPESQEKNTTKNRCSIDFFFFLICRLFKCRIF